MGGGDIQYVFISFLELVSTAMHDGKNRDSGFDREHPRGSWDQRVCQKGSVGI